MYCGGEGWSIVAERLVFNFVLVQLSTFHQTHGFLLVQYNVFAIFYLETKGFLSWFRIEVFVFWGEQPNTLARQLFIKYVNEWGWEGVRAQTH